MRRCLVLAVAVTTAVPAVAEPERPSLDIYVSAQGRTPTLDDAKVVAVERCYRERFGTQRKAGELRLAFQVTPGGRTRGVTVSSFDKKLDRCVITQARLWMFGASKTTTRYAYTIGFPELSSEEAAQFAQMLGGDDPADRNPGADLNAQIRGDKKVGEGRGLELAPMSPVGPNVYVPGRVSLAAKKALDATSLDVDTVTKKIQDAYASSLQRCYRQQLAKTPDLRTTLQIAFTVDAGRATAIAIASGEPGLDACVKGLVAAWRFPRPTVGDKPATARFELALALSPD